MSCSAPAPTAAPALRAATSEAPNSGKINLQNPGGDEAAATVPNNNVNSNSNDQASLNYLAQLRSASALLEAVIGALQTATQVQSRERIVLDGQLIHCTLRKHEVALFTTDNMMLR